MELRMRYSLPVHLEQKLCNKYGWAVKSQKFNECIIFVKARKGEKKVEKPTIRVKAGSTGTLMFSPGVTEKEKDALYQRCDTIVGFFPDPYSAIQAVRQRLHNMSQSLPLAQRQVVLNYMEEEFPESYNDNQVKKKGMAGS
jgi:hypothetical protein